MVAGAGTGSWARTASSAASAVATQLTTNGALTPPIAITAPPIADPSEMPPISIAEIQVNASVSVPRVTTRPTSAYWQEKTGAIVRPASTLATTPSGTVRTAIRGALKPTAMISSRR